MRRALTLTWVLGAPLWRDSVPDVVVGRWIVAHGLAGDRRFRR